MKFLSILFAVVIGISVSCTNRTSQAVNQLRRMNPESYFSDRNVIDLIRSLDRNNLQKANEAITRGASVNAIGNEEMTPLAWTFSKQNLVGYRYLLEKCANPNYITKKVAWNNDGQSVMQFSALSENPEYLTLALKHGGDPNAPDSLKDQTILFCAIENKRSENIKILAKFGADLNHADQVGSTPLMHCVYRDEYDLAWLLLELGANPSIRNRRGNNVGNIVSLFGDRGIKVRRKEKEQRAYYEKFIVELQRRGLMK